MDNADCEFVTSDIHFRPAEAEMCNLSSRIDLTSKDLTTKKYVRAST
jgi:hypothetical protein